MTFDVEAARYLANAYWMPDPKSQHHRCGELVLAACDEIERLRKNIAIADEDYEFRNTEAVKLRADNERMREALREIRHHAALVDGSPGEHGLAYLVDDIARRALVDE